MIRVAQLGWDGNRQADAADDVSIGIGCWWVEVNGVRIDRVVRVEFAAQDDEFTMPRLIIDVADGMEIVYVGKDGEPLPGASVPVTEIPAIDDKTALHRDVLTAGLEGHG